MPIYNSTDDSMVLKAGMIIGRVRQKVEEDEESEELVNAVLDELGCAVNGDLVSVPTSKAGEGKKVEVVQEEKKEAVLEDAGSIGGGGVENSNNNGGIDDDLQARLDNLRKT